MLERRYIACFVWITSLFSFSANAFDFPFEFKNKYFEDVKYKFKIVRIIDARLNKSKQIGEVLSGLTLRWQTVGSDTIEEQMNRCFSGKGFSFDSSRKIILVINQINLRYIHEYSSVNERKIEAIETSVSYDYYLQQGNSFVLFYKHYCINMESAALKSTAKAINKSFSVNVKLSFENLDRLVEKGLPMPGGAMSEKDLLDSLRTRPKQVIGQDNIKDGIYFSIKDMYLNKPGLTGAVYFPDTNLLGKKPVSLYTNKYMMRRAYAVVLSKRIYIYCRDDYYKEALMDEEGHLYFPDVTAKNISSGAAAGSALLRVLPGGLLGMLLAEGVKKSGTKVTKSDVVIDYETGDLVVLNP